MSKNIKKNNFSVFAPKNITFGNILTQKYRTYLPVCACTECPPLGIYRCYNYNCYNYNTSCNSYYAFQESLRCPVACKPITRQEAVYSNFNVTMECGILTIFPSHEEGPK